ncbi:hypothetical protein, partial [Hymenobacter terrestris]|uniref:hypothetical protein n=1 Tax=Hymenobacter terrestris TaxID=2748310 RepID=UPI001C40A4BA
YNGDDYEFEINLGSKKGKSLQIIFENSILKIDTVQGVYTDKKYILRNPPIGKNTVKGKIFERWRRPNSDTVWTDWYGFQHTFYVKN